MYDPFALVALSIESQRVVGLRLMKLAQGGPGAGAEAHRMVSEKLSALANATDTLMAGGSVDAVVASYRDCVAANIERLLTPDGAGQL